MNARKDAIPERVRAQLLALGIPAADHTAVTLATLFPLEFNIAALGLETEDLARVLVHFTHQGIISPAGSGKISLKKVEPGWHFCQFYRDTAQLLGMITPYIAEGLANGEACLWVVPDAIPLKAACNALAQRVDGVSDLLASGQLEVFSHRSWYLDPTGRLKSFEQITDALFAKQDQALSRGYKFLRAAGDTGWVSGTEESKDFIDYEMKVNAAIGATRIAAVCTYRADVTADELVAIVTAHQDAVYQAA